MFSLVIPLAWMSTYLEALTLGNAVGLAAFSQVARGELPHDLMGREVELPKTATSDLKPFEWCYTHSKKRAECGCGVFEGEARTEEKGATGAVALWG